MIVFFEPFGRHKILWLVAWDVRISYGAPIGQFLLEGTQFQKHKTKNISTKQTN